MKRRANGEGSISKRRDGRWMGYLTVPGLDDSSARKWAYGRSSEEVAGKLAALREALGKAPRYHEADVLFADYAQSWLSYQRPHIKPRTYTVYAGELRKNVYPHLGALRLSAIGPQHIRRMQHSVLESSGPVAARQARGRTRTILQQAFDDGLLPRNPAATVKPVAAPPRQYDVWGEAEIDTFMRAAKSHPAYPLFYLGLMTGLRPGELLALQWGDIAEDVVHVRRTITQPGGGMVLGPPKSPAAVRAVPLPGDARELLFTRACKIEVTPSLTAFVFPSSRGTLYSPRNAHQRLWLPLLATVGLVRVRPYVLRHTYATLQIAAGVDAATLARWMGHTDAAFTLRCYGHYFERRGRTQARTLDELLGRA